MKSKSMKRVSGIKKRNITTETEGIRKKIRKLWTTLHEYILQISWRRASSFRETIHTADTKKK